MNTLYTTWLNSSMVSANFSLLARHPARALGCACAYMNSKRLRKHSPQGTLAHSRTIHNTSGAQKHACVNYETIYFFVQVDYTNAKLLHIFLCRKVEIGPEIGHMFMVPNLFPYLFSGWRVYVEYWVQVVYHTFVPLH